MPDSEGRRSGISAAITHSDDFEKVYIGGALVGDVNKDKWKPVILITNRNLANAQNNVVELEYFKDDDTGFLSHDDFPLITHLIVECDSSVGSGRILGATSNRNSATPGNMVYGFALYTTAGSSCVPSSTDAKNIF